MNACLGKIYFTFCISYYMYFTLAALYTIVDFLQCVVQMFLRRVYKYKVAMMDHEPCCMIHTVNFHKTISLPSALH